MIESIRQAFADLLDDGFYQRNRRVIDQQMRHTFHIKHKDIENALFTELQRVIQEHTEEISKNPGLFPVAIPWDAKVAKKYCKEGADIICRTSTWERSLETKVKEFSENLGIDQRTPKYARGFKNYFSFLPGGRDIKFVFKIGEIDVKRGDTETSLSPNRDRSAAVVKQTNRQMLQDVFGDSSNKELNLNGKGVRKKYIEAVTMGQLSDAATYKEGKGTGYSRYKARLTHGATERGEEGSVAIMERDWLGRKKAVGTVATIGLSREMDRLKSDTKATAGTFAGAGPNAVDVVIEEIENALTKKYKLDAFRDTKTNGINRKFWVQLELEGDQKAMEVYDRSGIKTFLEEHDAELVKLLQNHPQFSGMGLLQLQGSPSLKDDMDAIVPYLMSKGLLTKAGKIDRRKVKTTKGGGLDMRKTINKQLVAEAKAHMNKSSRKSTKLVKGGKKRVRKTSIKGKGVAAPGTFKQRAHQKSKVNAKAGQNPLALRGLINAALAKTIAGKMEAPALVYRTGRFAESAQVDNIMMGPRGKTMIDYTYMKMPYQTFEPGFAQGSINRDPRRIIGESIREIAQSIMGDKFLHIRRV